MIYGATFVCGVSLLNEKLCQFLWNDLSFQKGLGIVLLIYIAGMLLQELGSAVDKYWTNIYKGMHRSILTGEKIRNFDKETSNCVFENPVVLSKYRDSAKELLEKIEMDTNGDWYNNKYYNGYIFSLSQYYVSIKGRDKKVEKLRALFSMSKTLMSCFFLLAICALGTLAFNIEMFINICSNLGFTTHGCEQCMDKIIMIVVFLGIGFVFKSRAKRTMRNFLLILLGTYNAILEEENKNDKTNRG
ncbi:MAG: hypothetical protein E7536_09420 [Ruminococcaceae bacterium]|nr:hypothetical protein [Oscillospiraceae bacterium]